MFGTAPTLTFKQNGRVYTVNSICEETNVVHASMTAYGRRLRGRPKHFDVGNLPPLTVRPIHRRIRGVTISRPKPTISAPKGSTFVYRGETYSVTKRTNDIVHASKVVNGRRQRGRPRHFAVA